MRKTQGLTLIELMVTVAIIGILAAIGTPSLKDFLEQSKIKAEAQRISGVLSLARAHAVSINQGVVVSRSVTGGALALTAFIDVVGNPYVYTNGDTLVKQSGGRDSKLHYGVNSEVTINNNNALLFNARGRLANPTTPTTRATTPAIMTVCDNDQNSGLSISVNPVGRVSISEVTSQAACL